MKSQAIDLYKNITHLIDLLSVKQGPSECRYANHRDWLRSINGKNFYAVATQAVGCETINQAQKMFSPKATYKSTLAQTTSHSNQWRRYKNGLSAPEDKTIRSASRTAKTNLLPQVRLKLWQTIDLDWSVRNQIGNMLASCGNWQILNLHSSLVDAPSWLDYLQNTYDAPDEYPDPSWEACEAPTLDSLTALTALYRWIANRSKPADHRRVARPLFFVLLALAPELARRGICDALFAYYLRFIFPLTEAGRIDESLSEMLLRAYLLGCFSSQRIADSESQHGHRTGVTYADLFGGASFGGASFGGATAAFQPRFTLQMPEESAPALAWGHLEQLLLRRLLPTGDWQAGSKFTSLPATLIHSCVQRAECSSTLLPSGTSRSGLLPWPRKTE
ncbi:MAG: hypothetical protein KIS62_00795 [Ramlibacter sp.]|nr:hypothetical protein [Ramlibacter sp.]